MVTRVNVRNGERGMFNPAVVRDRGGERAGEQLWVVGDVTVVSVIFSLLIKHNCPPLGRTSSCSMICSPLAHPP